MIETTHTQYVKIQNVFTQKIKNIFNITFCNPSLIGLDYLIRLTLKINIYFNLTQINFAGDKKGILISFILNIFLLI